MKELIDLIKDLISNYNVVVKHEKVCGYSESYTVTTEYSLKKKRA